MSNDYVLQSERKYPVPEAVVSIMPYERNPQHGVQPLTVQAQQWVFETSLFSQQKFKRISGTTEFTDYFWPFCSNPDRYEILIKLIVNLFVLDDHLETPYGDIDRRVPEAEAIFGQLYRVYDKLLQPTDSAGQPESVPFHDWKPYVLGAYAIYDKWTDGMVEECAHLQHNKVFDNLDEFFEVREKSVAILMIYHLIEYAENLFVPESEWLNPIVQQLLQKLSRLAVICNDMYSLEKELMDAGNKGPSGVYNCVAVFAQMQNISLEESMTHWSKEFKDLETIIVKLSDEILAADWASPDTRRFVRSAMYATGGHWKVSTMLDRSCSLKSSESLFKAISQLVRLTSVDLSDNQEPTEEPCNLLTKLADNSFTLQSVNDSQYNPLRINLKLNQIAQIGDQAFAGLDRPVTLDLSFNNLTQLTANTFAHMLSYEPSKIIIKGNHVNCVCGLKWVYVNSTIRPKMSGLLRCDDKRYFSSLTDTDFKNCT
ncbi:unnamed protein product [Medioppia subpectinata]|uniref:Terpene synthase n=1 Tax=Medioppia subpectinata TaxID=1979941 RepID=A0A7R9KMA9_9ACAR|nr:unnamed protein product [Medioppia subpectinata]CAG2106248.1 unnamed protein product [Medioppia subpectinata]